MNRYRITVFCFPYAGGNIYSYREFQNHVEDCIYIHSLELPGRGRRIRELLLTDFDSMVDDMLNQIQPSLTQPYAIYGHSMGGLLGYLVIHRIIELGGSLPCHFFVSGCIRPSALMAQESPMYHLLSRDEFIAMLRSLGGSPKEVLDNTDMMSLLEPILRADYKAYETYQFKHMQAFPVPITAWMGDRETTTYEDAMAWQRETSSTFSLKEFSGDHFFIFDNLPEICRIISQILMGIVQSEPDKVGTMKNYSL